VSNGSYELFERSSWNLACIRAASVLPGTRARAGPNSSMVSSAWPRRCRRTRQPLIYGCSPHSPVLLGAIDIRFRHFERLSKIRHILIGRGGALVDSGRRVAGLNPAL